MLHLSLFAKAGTNKDRRRRPRVFMDLPVEVREADGGEIHGGMIIDGSEIGFLIYSIKEMSIGLRLNLSILFSKGSYFTNLEVMAEIVRKKRRASEGQTGYEYGLKIVEIGEKDFQKLKYLLHGNTNT